MLPVQQCFGQRPYMANKGVSKNPKRHAGHLIQYKPDAAAEKGSPEFLAKAPLRRGAVEKKTVLENLDLVLLAMDEIIDGG